MRSNRKTARRTADWLAPISRVALLFSVFGSILFSANPAQAWSVRSVYKSLGADGHTLPAGLVRWRGSLYGVAAYGGAYNCGTVFKLTPSLRLPYPREILHHFQGGSDGGCQPRTQLLVGRDGFLYGATEYGGSNGNYGLIFRLRPRATPGSWRFEIVHRFEGGFSGFSPGARLLQDAEGAIYGATAPVCFGVDQYRGATLFRLSPPAAGQTNWTHQVLIGGNRSNRLGGAIDLALGPDGAPYGVTTGCDIYNRAGRVFRLSRPSTVGGAWRFRSLFDFPGGGQGYEPRGLTLSADDANRITIYGVTAYGGAKSKGVVFRLRSPARVSDAWLFDVLHSFGATSASLEALCS